MRTKSIIDHYMRYSLLFLFFWFFMQPLHAQSEKETILFFGDSITAGYGIEQDKAFPALIRNKIDSLGLNFKVQNGGLSGETSAGGLRRIDWMLQNEIDIFVLELGGNDGLRGIEPQSTKQNLIDITKKVRQKYPDAAIVLAGMQVPPNLGQDYTRQFKAIYPDLAKELGVALIPFLLEDVGGKSDLMQADGIHPTAAGHKIMAENVWDTLKPILKERRAQ